MKKNKKKYIYFFISLILPMSVLVLWGILSKRINNNIILPPISKVLLNFKEANKDFINLGSLPSNLFISFIRVSLGFIIGSLIALPLGILMGYDDRIYYLFKNIINMLRPIPPMGWTPLIVSWFGVSSLATLFRLPYGSKQVYFSNFKFSMIFIISLGAFFPILTNTILGVRSVEKSFIESAKILGADRLQIFMKVILPAAVPSIITGLRIGLGAAWGCLVAAEMLPGSMAGLGYLITHAYELARTDLVIMGIICIGVMGSLLDNIFLIVEKKKCFWKS